MITRRNNKVIILTFLVGSLFSQSLDELKKIQQAYEEIIREQMAKEAISEELYKDGEISFAGNGRYFIFTEEQQKPNKTSASKSEEVDVKAELKKFKEMLDDGLITQEDYDTKKKELMGL